MHDIARARTYRKKGPDLRKEWRGTWGPISDLRSRLGRLVKIIEKELIAEYKPTTYRQRRIVRGVAQLEALAAMTADTLGQDDKSTRRTLTALERAAMSKLGQLKASLNGRREPAFDPVAEFAKERREP